MNTKLCASVLVIGIITASVLLMDTTSSEAGLTAEQKQKTRVSGMDDVLYSAIRNPRGLSCDHILSLGRRSRKQNRRTVSNERRSRVILGLLDGERCW